MTKAIYISEYDNGDDIQAEWFVAPAELEYDDRVKEAYKHIAEMNDDKLEDVKKWVKVISCWEINKKMIKEVAESYK